MDRLVTILVGIPPRTPVVETEKKSSVLRRAANRQQLLHA